MTDDSASAERQRVLGNLKELSEFHPDMPSEPTIKKLIDDNPDFPIITRGDRGVPWEIDLAAAALFIRDLRRKDEEAARARSAELRQFGFDLLGPDAATAQPDRPELTAADQKAMIEAEIAAIKLGQLRGEFVRRAEVELALSELGVAFKQRFTTLPDRVAKRITLPREAQTALQKIVDADLGWVADQLEKLGNAPPTDRNDTAVRDGGDAAAPGGGAVAAQASYDGNGMGD